MGDVTPAGGGTTSPAAGASYTYGEGAVVTVSAAAASGYRFVNWSGDLAGVPNPNLPTIAVTMNAERTIAASFVAVPTYTLTMGTDPVAGGTTSPGAGEHLYTEGEAVSINATAYAGYRFVSWTGEVADPNAQSTTVTMDAAKTVTAVFEGAPIYTFTVDYYIKGNAGNRTYQRIGAESPTPPIFTFEITRADFIAAGFNTLGGNLFNLTISHMHNGDKLDNPENWVVSFDDGSVVTTIGILSYSALAFIDETMPGIFDLSGADWKFILSETSDDGPYDTDRLFLDKVTISNVPDPEP
jgi:hypothetical protein